MGGERRARGERLGEGVGVGGVVVTDLLGPAR
jgi:hypothetical protein